MPRYSDNGFGEEKQVLDAAPVEPGLEQLMLEFWLSKSRELLTADDPDTRVLLGSDSPEALSAKLVSGTKLGDPAVRKALWDGGMAAIEASDDPMIRFMLRIDPEARRARRAYEDKVGGPATRAAEAIAKARFAVLGDSVYPMDLHLAAIIRARGGWASRGKTVAPPASPAFDATGRRRSPRPAGSPQSWLKPDTVFNP